MGKDDSQISRLATQIELHVAQHEKDRLESISWKQKTDEKIDKILSSSIEQNVEIRNLSTKINQHESILVDHGKLLAKIDDDTKRMQNELYNADTGIVKRHAQLWDIKNQIKPIIWVLGVAVVAIVGMLVDRVSEGITSRRVAQYQYEQKIN